MHTASSKYTQRYIDQGFQMVMLVADRLAMSNYVKAEVGQAHRVDAAGADAGARTNPASGA